MAKLFISVRFVWPKGARRHDIRWSSVHVDYCGDVDTDDNRLILHYARKGNSVNPDHDNAFLSQVGKNGLQGYYESHVNSENHQTLDLERINQTCNLNYFEDGW